MKSVTIYDIKSDKFFDIKVDTKPELNEHIYIHDRGNTIEGIVTKIVHEYYAGSEDYILTVHIY